MKNHSNHEHCVVGKGNKDKPIHPTGARILRLIPRTRAPEKTTLGRKVWRERFDLEKYNREWRETT